VRKSLSRISLSNKKSIPLLNDAYKSSSEQWDETWDFGTIRPSYGHNTGVRRHASRNVSGTMRAVNNAAQGREPLQPLPAMQRPMTPPESQCQSPKYCGVAKNECEPSSPKKEGKLQVSSREEINLYDSTESDSEPVQYRDFEPDDEGIVGTSTVKISDRLSHVPDAQPQNPGWGTPRAPPVKSPSPPKSVAYARSGSQVSTPAQSRHGKSDIRIPSRTSTMSSTVTALTSPSAPTFGVNLPPRPPPKQAQRKNNTLEDILLPALDQVGPNCI
jgi:hypothetical protein